MIDLSIQSILDKASSLLGGLPTKGELPLSPYTNPYRAFVSACFLVNDKKDYHLSDLHHVYNPTRIVHDPSFVLHGHDSRTLCAASHFCHLVGYVPEETSSPAFKKNFNRKWKHLYEK